MANYSQKYVKLRIVNKHFMLQMAHFSRSAELLLDLMVFAAALALAVVVVLLLFFFLFFFFLFFYSISEKIINQIYHLEFIIWLQIICAVRSIPTIEDSNNNLRTLSLHFHMTFQMVFASSKKIYVQMRRRRRNRKKLSHRWESCGGWNREWEREEGNERKY